jgi:hypothetical protein
MKSIQTLIFILMAFKMVAQDAPNKRLPLVVSLKPRWDIHLGMGFAGQFENQLGVQVGLNGRFKKHLFASLTYMGSTEVNSLFPIEIISATPLKPDDNINNFSLVTGVCHSTKFFYGALGLGLGSTQGHNWNYATKTQNRFHTLGLEIKAQTTFVFWKYMGFGLSYNYNVNKLKNVNYFMFGWQIGLMR